MTTTDGTRDISAAVDALAARLPEPLRPLARLAHNYAWSWTLDGRALFHDFGPHHWERSSGNLVRFLEDLTPTATNRIVSDPNLLARIDVAVRSFEAAVAPLASQLDGPVDWPVAFLCAEFGIHTSLPIYSGGLGILAGDILKEASDRGVPLVGVGLLYGRGYFHQRVDLAGWQHEHWTQLDPEHHTAVRVTTAEGGPLLITVPLYGRDVVVQIWRVDVGRVPLFLLDAERPENRPVDRWITARLYEGNRAIRLAQYGLLGIGGVRALRALGIEPGVWHLNEGHPALATLELTSELVAAGTPFEAAAAQVRERVVFTTHTPVPAGNETYDPGEVVAAYPGLADRLGIDTDRLLGLGRVRPERTDEQVGMTPIAMRMSRSVNGVSRRHGEVSRGMWQPLFARATEAEVPITHVTNGVHLPTFMAPPMRIMLDRALGPDWLAHAADPAVWRDVDAIPATELWAVRNRLRAGLVERVRQRSIRDRLLRGEQIDYVEAAAETFDDHVLTLGCARRIATYKRLHLLTRDPARALALIDEPRPLQLLFAGKAHPKDDAAKAIVADMFSLKADARVGRRVAFLEDYEMSMAAWLVAGCDVWLNLPRPPNEASGTSGMKAALNGALNLSVLDGWWSEGYDGSNGWAIEGGVDPDEAAQDERHAAALYDLLESQVVPLFYDRDADGIPQGWVEMVRSSLRTLGPAFNATRMVGDYVRAIYPGR